jgi:hypothetical protein
MLVGEASQGGIVRHRVRIGVAFFDHGANRIWSVARLIPRN